MRHIAFLLVAGLMAVVIRTVAQPICGFDGFLKEINSVPASAERIKIAENKLQDIIKTGPLLPQPQGAGTALYTIPVVVHIVHTGDAVGTNYNPTDAQISSVLTYLNQAFDGTATGFSGGAGDIQVQFTLAKRDPNCNPTTGIDRVNGSSLSGYTTNGVNRNNSGGISDLTLKNQSRWDASRYYNIWVVNKIDGNDGTSGQFVAGYSTFAGSDLSVDGIVMLATQFYPGSKVLPHEMGHALNLYHPFQGSANNSICPANNNCNSDGDKVCDTDPISFNATAAGVVTFTCRTGTNPCTGTSYQTNTENNVMNYTNCFTLFTAGQKTRMLAAMSLPSRVSLVNSTAQYPPDAGPSPCQPKINFEMAETTVTESSVSFESCRGYQDYSFKMTIGNSPAASATATLVASGTAVAGMDYALTTNGNFASPSNSIVFPAGVNTARSFTVRIYDDASVEPDKTLVLNYTVDNGGGNAAKGEAIPKLTVVIKNNDSAPEYGNAQVATIGSFGVNLVSGGSSHPFDAKLASKKSSMLYKASELTGMGLTAGKITSFGIYLEKFSTRPYTNLQIKMGATTVSNLVDGSVSNVPVTTVKTVESYQSKAGLNAFALDVPFTWDGSANIVVQFCYDNLTADAQQAYDVCLGYSDGGSSSQGNMFWQNNISCGTSYSSVTYLSEGKKPAGYFVIGKTGPQTEDILNATGSAYLGPNENVYFYSDAGNLLARIKNLSSHDYGCTQVSIDRAGTATKGYMGNAAGDAVSDKTIRVIPTNNNPSGSYEITLYFKPGEVSGWEAATGQDWNNIQLLKTPGAVSSYTPGQVPPGVVEAATAIKGNYGPDYTVSAVFNSGLSGFAVGNPLFAQPVIYTFTGSGLWSDTSNWSNNSVPPDTLPAGSQIIIDHQPGGECILNKMQMVSPGATLKVNPSKNLVIRGNFEQQ